MNISSFECDVSKLNVNGIKQLLESQGLEDNVEVVEQKCIDGNSLLVVSNAVINTRKINENSTNLKKFVEEIIDHSDIRIDTIQHVTKTTNETIMHSETNVYHTPVNRVSDTTEYVDRLLKKLKPTPSFLYQYKLASNIDVKSKENQSYIPMKLPTRETRSEKRNIRGKISSVYSNFPNFEAYKFRWYQRSQPKKRGSVEFDDRGYYTLGWKAKTQENIVRCSSYDTVSDAKPGYCKFEGVNMNEQNEEIIEEHFYEDLSETNKTEDFNSGNKWKKITPNLIPKASCLDKFNEIVASLSVSKDKIMNLLFSPDSKRFRINMKRFSRNESASVDLANNSGEIRKADKQLSVGGDSMYISDGEISEEEEYAVIGSVVEQKRDKRRKYEETTLVEVEVTKIDVEEYLEPKPWKPAERLYSNVFDMDKVHIVPDISHYDCLPKRDLTGRKIIEEFPEEKQKISQTSIESYHDPTSGIQTIATASNSDIEPPERPMETLHRWNEALKMTSGKRFSLNMADRPLPVPVENEFYYMEVSRLEAIKLLDGHEDGTFILRPSSQPEHAYTISLVYQNMVFNVGVRRRPDSRLALGYAKNTEQSFLTIKDLIEHHYGEKLILIIEGERIGSTVLKKLEYA